MSTTTPRVVTRAEWGAKPYRGTPERLGRVKRITVHHTATTLLPRTRDEGIRAVRQVQQMHFDRPPDGWSDIGYHLLLAQDGTWYRGRVALGSAATLAEIVQADAWAKGSHVGGHNTGNLGLSAMGYFHAPHNHRMTPEATESLRAMLAYLTEQYDLLASAVVGHRELASTACPGDLLFPVLRDIRKGLGPVPAR